MPFSMYTIVSSPFFFEIGLPKCSRNTASGQKIIIFPCAFGAIFADVLSVLEQALFTAWALYTFYRWR